MSAALRSLRRALQAVEKARAALARLDWDTLSAVEADIDEGVEITTTVLETIAADLREAVKRAARAEARR